MEATKAIQQNTTQQRQHLSPSELAELKRLKLCFKCRAKWYKGHICGSPELKILTVINGEEVEISEECWEAELLTEGEQPTQMMVISLCAFLGMDSPTTTKLRGLVGKTPMVVLIDSGASHNFFAPQFIKKAKLNELVNPNLQVLLGTGILVNGSGVCQNIEMELQGLHF